MSSDSQAANPHIIPELLRENFDAEFYLECNPDVAKSGMDPIIHFIEFGAKEGRNPTSYFSTTRYMALFGHEISAGQNPFLHYLLNREKVMQHSADSGDSQPTKPDPERKRRDSISLIETHVDREFYIAHNNLKCEDFPSVAAVAEHYYDYGAAAGYDPNPSFFTRFYLSTHIDVARAGLNPLLHFIQHGQFEGRLAGPLNMRHTSRVDATDIAGRSCGGAAKPSSESERVDGATIVVPIYNALDDIVDLLRCLDRTVHPEQPIVLVDDASTDDRIKPVLEQWCAGRAGAEHLTNLENRGFSASMNRGVERGSGDIVLLNSDLLLPAGWLSRLIAPLRTEDARVAFYGSCIA